MTKTTSRIRRELVGIYQDIIAITALIVAGLVILKGITILLAVITGIVNLVLTIAGLVLLTCIVLYAITRMTMPTPENNDVRTEGREG